MTSIVQANPITEENLNPGSRGWVLSPDGSHAATDAVGQIKGYMSATSVNKGQSIDFKISVSPAQNFTIEVYRVGYYGGMGARLMQTIGPIAGTTQETCPRDPSTGLVECNWSTSYTLTIPSTWTSGVYLAKLTNAANFDSGAIFVVRDDARKADFLYQQPVATYQAYNQYPEGVNGSSLYSGDLSGLPKAVKVSFNRPYAGYRTNFNGYGHFLEEEINLIKWLEKEGYDVSYSTNVDIHTNTLANGQRLLDFTNYHGFISGGHDEYWSKEMRDAVQNARDNKLNLAFFGANDAYWQVRFEPSSNGTPNRTMVCYKSNALDPEPNEALKTNLFRSSAVNRPEQELMGVQYITFKSFYNPTTYTDLIVKTPAHWAFAGTNLVEGQRFPGLVGYEIDNMNAPVSPLNSELTVLFESQFIDHDNAEFTQQSVIYRAKSLAEAPLGWVFASGTMAYSWALDYEPSTSVLGRPFGVDLTNASLQKVTHNILDRMLNEPAAGNAVINGLAQEDQVLTVSASSINDYDGLGSFSYQWLRNGSNISGATGPSYILGDADVGNQIAVRVSFTDGRGKVETISSNSTSAVINVNDVPVGTVSINGLAGLGEQLTVSNNLSDGDGLGTVSYQWQRNGVNINGATSNKYLITASDLGQQVSVVASYTDGRGTFESVASAKLTIANISGIKSLQNLSSGQCADVYFLLVWFNGVPVTQSVCNEQSNKKWSIETVGSFYRLVNRASGKAMTVNNGSLSTNASIIQQSWNGSNSQLWKVSPAPTNGFNLINKGSNLCLSVSSNNSGAALMQKTCSNNAQKWNLR
jgi:Ricin-type beta-trefoil lectin domain-like